MSEVKYPRTPQINVIVTQELIDAAVRRDSSHCMIAEALRDAAPWGTSPSVDTQTIRISNPEKGFRYTYLTPRVAQYKIRDWDEGKVIEPFDFQLRNGQVTLMNRRKRGDVAPRGKPQSEAQKAASLKSLEKAHKSNPTHIAHDLAKAHIITDGNSNIIPRVVGGRPPPMSRRRSYGLRVMEY